MTNSEIVHVPRKVYIYKDKTLTLKGGVSASTEKNFEGLAWRTFILQSGFTTSKDVASTEMETHGGIEVSVYYRNTFAKQDSEDNILTGYDFVVDIGGTYIVLLEDLPTFLGFSAEHLVQSQVNTSYLSYLENIKDALYEIDATLGQVDYNIRQLK